MEFETLTVKGMGRVVFVDILAPPMNLMGPALVRDLVSLFQNLEEEHDVRVVVFRSGDPDYFIAHVDVGQIAANRQEAARFNGDASMSLLLRHLSTSRVVTIAQIAGRVRGIGSEFALACDMRFAAIGSAKFCQFEGAFGVLPGAGGLQHLTRLMGRARALEVMLSCRDYDAELAERYAWINRALPDDQLDAYVASLAHDIALLPASSYPTIRDRVNAIALPAPEDLKRDAELFVEGLREPIAQRLLQSAVTTGLQSREAELDLPVLLGGLLRDAAK